MGGWMISILWRHLIGSLSIMWTYFTISLRNYIFYLVTVHWEIEILPFSIGSILSFLMLMNSWNWSLFVFAFLMANVWHLSTRMIKSPQVVHLIKTLHKSWLSFSNAITMAVLSANWNQCFGDKEPWYTYPMHSTFSELTVLINPF